MIPNVNKERMKFFCFLLFSFHFFDVVSSGSNDDTDREFVTVKTSLGDVQGIRRGNVNTFLGIPFAEPPLGKNRFRPPAEKKAWFPEALRAYNFSPECLQSELFAGNDGKIFRDEDCLYLNIWQPVKKRKDGLYPVMIWIYGGAFMHGGASKPEYMGNKLAERGVIVVSLNYRLGALGFLVSVADGLFGNYGLDDQKMAVQWVQSNIRHFNGDTKRMTLFGESAGAMSIGLHLLDQENQLHRHKEYKIRNGFQAIIMQSNPLGYK